MKIHAFSLKLPCYNNTTHTWVFGHYNMQGFVLDWWVYNEHRSVKPFEPLFERCCICQRDCVPNQSNGGLLSCMITFVKIVLVSQRVITLIYWSEKFIFSFYSYWSNIVSMHSLDLRLNCRIQFTDLINVRYL